ncbi:hypothetical protein CsatB_017789 [Cannabis sativa]|uniref:uncharacterized protein LOC115710536 n=1 Tax=Cannabis sativa TaxID=3483 RepID=UPI0029CA295D|nr:uncharacterized protein LOC115710536 [Cannabis sativa]
MDYLTRLLIQRSKKKGFRFHPLCKSLGLVNLCFADDLIIFCKGNNKFVQLVKEAFLLFSDATGLVANKAKSTVSFGDISTTCKQRLANILQMEEGSFPLKYLGVNLRPTKWRAADCGIIIDKIHKHLHTWASRNLSFVERAQLIHSVLLGVMNYWMSLFVLPQKITVIIDKCCRDFLWGSNGNRSKMHIPSWEKVCLSKNSGGLGFREGKK